MIRSARHDDFDAVAAITNHYIATSSIHFAYEPIDPATVRQTWREGCERYPWYVAESSSRVVGYAKAAHWRERAAYAWTAEIGLYVMADERGRGIGRALYETLLGELDRRGFRSAIAGITLPNDPSIALHRAFGFVSVGTVRDAGYKQGAWHDVEFWQKHFRTGPTPP